MTAVLIVASFTRPDLTGELQWPVQPNLDPLIHFLLCWFIQRRIHETRNTKYATRRLDCRHQLSEQYGGAGWQLTGCKTLRMFILTNCMYTRTSAVRRLKTFI